MDNRDDRSRQWSELLEKIRGIKYAMLTTENEQGHLHSRPMATLEATEEGVLWFFTGRSSAKTQDIGIHPRVNLSYVDGGKDTFLSVAGESRLVEDPRKAEELWNPFMKAWFPQGMGDPDLGLLRVEVETVEYWDVSSKKMTTLIQFIKSMAGASGGKGPDDQTGHGTLRARDRY